MSDSNKPKTFMDIFKDPNALDDFLLSQCQNQDDDDDLFDFDTSRDSDKSKSRASSNTGKAYADFSTHRSGTTATPPTNGPIPAPLFIMQQNVNINNENAAHDDINGTTSRDHIPTTGGNNGQSATTPNRPSVMSGAHNTTLKANTTSHRPPHNTTVLSQMIGAQTNINVIVNQTIFDRNEQQKQRQQHNDASKSNDIAIRHSQHQQKLNSLIKSQSSSNRSSPQIDHSSDGAIGIASANSMIMMNHQMHAAMLENAAASANQKRNRMRASNVTLQHLISSQTGGDEIPTSASASSVSATNKRTRTTRKNTSMPSSQSMITMPSCDQQLQNRSIRNVLTNQLGSSSLQSLLGSGGTEQDMQSPSSIHIMNTLNRQQQPSPIRSARQMSPLSRNVQFGSNDHNNRLNAFIPIGETEQNENGRNMEQNFNQFNDQQRQPNVIPQQQRQIADMPMEYLWPLLQKSVRQPDRAQNGQMFVIRSAANSPTQSSNLQQINLSTIHQQRQLQQLIQQQNQSLQGSVDNSTANLPSISSTATIGSSKTQSKRVRKNNQSFSSGDSNPQQHKRQQSIAEMINQNNCLLQNVSLQQQSYAVPQSPQQICDSSSNTAAVVAAANQIQQRRFELSQQQQRQSYQQQIISQLNQSRNLQLGLMNNQLSGVRAQQLNIATPVTQQPQQLKPQLYNFIRQRSTSPAGSAVARPSLQHNQQHIVPILSNNAAHLTISPTTSSVAQMPRSNYLYFQQQATNQQIQLSNLLQKNQQRPQQSPMLNAAAQYDISSSQHLGAVGQFTQRQNQQFIQHAQQMNTRFNNDTSLPQQLPQYISSTQQRLTRQSLNKYLEGLSNNPRIHQQIQQQLSDPGNQNQYQQHKIMNSLISPHPTNSNMGGMEPSVAAMQQQSHLVQRYSPACEQQTSTDAAALLVGRLQQAQRELQQVPVSQILQQQQTQQLSQQLSTDQHQQQFLYQQLNHQQAVMAHQQLQQAVSQYQNVPSQTTLATINSSGQQKSTSKKKLTGKQRSKKLHQSQSNSQQQSSNSKQQQQSTTNNEVFSGQKINNELDSMALAAAHQQQRATIRMPAPQSIDYGVNMIRSDLSMDPYLQRYQKKQIRCSQQSFNSGFQLPTPTTSMNLRTAIATVANQQHYKQNTPSTSTLLKPVDLDILKKSGMYGTPTPLSKKAPINKRNQRQNVIAEKSVAPSIVNEDENEVTSLQPQKQKLQRWEEAVLNSRYINSNDTWRESEELAAIIDMFDEDETMLELEKKIKAENEERERARIIAEREKAIKQARAEQRNTYLQYCKKQYDNPDLQTPFKSKLNAAQRLAPYFTLVDPDDVSGDTDNKEFKPLSVVKLQGNVRNIANRYNRCLNRYKQFHKDSINILDPVLIAKEHISFERSMLDDEKSSNTVMEKHLKLPNRPDPLPLHCLFHTDAVKRPIDGREEIRKRIKHVEEWDADEPDDNPYGSRMCFWDEINKDPDGFPGFLFFRNHPAPTGSANNN
ncbi:hypothetical protein GJ496_006139 [Pomphorhynchus laevis]|nr:hypothetical protein GJ496_006139 [Pomphorhynchus laevis]